MRDTILEALSQRSELPALPDIVVKLQRMIRDPSANARDIARLIELDPVLAGRILHLANSAWYARSPEPIRTLPVAITKIGFTMLMNLIVSLRIGALFEGNRILNGPLFWRHSIAVAFLAQSLSQRRHAPQLRQDMMYLAGLMHDVGVMVFGYLAPEEYSRFIAHMGTAEEPLEVREREVFGIDHAELGALFAATWWEVDPAVSDAIRIHHRDTCGDESFPSAGSGPGRPEAVHLANRLCNADGITNGIAHPREDFDTAVAACRELADGSPETLVDDIRSSIARAEELLVLTGR